jgi:hypothetical protein
MANVQIRDVTAEAHRELKRRAARAGVSLSEYLRQEIDRIVARPPLAEVFARADSRSGGASVDDIVDSIAEGRSSR